MNQKAILVVTSPTIAGASNSSRSKIREGQKGYLSLRITFWVLGFQGQEQAPKDNSGGFRFSQWFKRDSPTKSLKNLQAFDGRRSFLHDEFNNLIGGRKATL